MEKTETTTKKLMVATLLVLTGFAIGEFQSRFEVEGWGYGWRIFNYPNWQYGVIALYDRDCVGPGLNCWGIK